MEPLAISRAEVEDFLYGEAALLDAWKLQDWLALFTEDARYFIPSARLDEHATADRSLFYIADDHQMLVERVARLYKNNAYAEFPHSKTRHAYSNVRVHSGEQASDLTAHCCFMTHRSRSGQSQMFVGSTKYTLQKTEAGLRIREKYCVLDVDDLHELGRISIIL